MILHLSLETRINLLTVLEIQQGNLGFLRTCGRIADKIELTDHEKSAAGFRHIPGPNGSILPAWKKDAQLPALEVQLDLAEREKLKQILEECPLFRRSDLAWVEPLLTELQK